MAIWDYLYPTKMIDSFLHPERGYQDASKQVQQGWNQAQEYQKPYYQNGLDQSGKLNTAEDQLLNPEGLQAKWAQGYTQSPYATDEINKSKNYGLDAASSMGLLGSSAALNNIQTGSTEIANKDRENYMQDLMKKFLSGIGIGQNMYGLGAGTAGNLGSQATQTGNNQAGLAYGEANAPGALLAQLLNLGGKAAQTYATGDASAGYSG
jgi:hypothetical protein